MAQDVVSELKRAAEGLLYPSETDAPFDVFRWPAGHGSARDQVAAHSRKGRAIEEMAVADFFKELEGADNAEGFEQLRQTLESNLSGLHIFRVGETRIDVYLIGQTPAGEWAGLHTISVET